jgi:16S rRNA processing protein RimM
MELVIGRIGKPHGVRGELVVEVRTDSPEERFAIGSVLHARGPRERATRDYVVEDARGHSGRLLLALAGVEDRTAAEALRGKLFVVDTEELPPSDDPDEYYDHQLQGLRAVTVAGDEIGTVAEVLHSSAGELLAVKDAAGREILIPFVLAIVPEISLAAGTVTIDPPKGLLNLDEADNAATDIPLQQPEA